jgi:hypothetical protein
MSKNVPWLFPGVYDVKFWKVFGLKKLKFLEGCTFKENSFSAAMLSCKGMQQFLILVGICVYD